MNKPVQVYMDDVELEQLESWARERGWTKSQAVRAAVRALVRSAEQDSLLNASGMIDGLPADCSERFDHYLEESFVAEKQTPYSSKAKRRRKPRLRG
jgi:Ribbon-helix-helix protein, copG family